MRVGIGRDIHRLVPGRRLIIGGVPVESPRGADAHSDGDALLHAIIDALLGAAALGDIGDRFPDSDPQYKDIDSRKLVCATLDLVKQQGFRVEQVDATVMLEAPKLGPLKQVIAASVAGLLELPRDVVNVKAKTAEGLGEVGQGLAIAAEAVAVLELA